MVSPTITNPQNKAIHCVYMAHNIKQFAAFFTPKKWGDQAGQYSKIDISFIKNSTQKPVSLRDIKIDLPELVSVSHYMIDSDPLNLALIKGDDLTEMEQVKSIDEKLTALFERSKQANNNVNVMSYKGLRSEEKERFLGHCQVGDTITTPYYLSSSRKQEVAQKFLSRSHGLNKILVIKGRSGLHLKHPVLNQIRSSGVDEDEVLYNKGTQFKITNIAKDEKFGDTLISMEEITNDDGFDS